jgi:hypothetical protein
MGTLVNRWSTSGGDLHSSSASRRSVPLFSIDQRLARAAASPSAVAAAISSPKSREDHLHFAQLSFCSFDGAAEADCCLLDRGTPEAFAKKKLGHATLDRTSGIWPGLFA